MNYRCYCEECDHFRYTPARGFDPPECWCAKESEWFLTELDELLGEYSEEEIEEGCPDYRDYRGD